MNPKLQLIPYSPLAYDAFREVINDSIHSRIRPECGDAIARSISEIYTPERLNDIPTLLGAVDYLGEVHAMGGIKYFEGVPELCGLYAKNSRRGEVGAFQIMATIADIASEISPDRVIIHALGTTDCLIQKLGAHLEEEVAIKDCGRVIHASRLAFDRDAYMKSPLLKVLKRIPAMESVRLNVA